MSTKVEPSKSALRRKLQHGRNGQEILEDYSGHDSGFRQSSFTDALMQQCIEYNNVVYFRTSSCGPFFRNCSRHSEVHNRSGYDPWPLVGWGPHTEALSYVRSYGSSWSHLSSKWKRHLLAFSLCNLSIKVLFTGRLSRTVLLKKSSVTWYKVTAGKFDVDPLFSMSYVMISVTGGKL